MIQLSDELRNALPKQGSSVRVTDPATNQCYVLLTAEDYDRLQLLVRSAVVDPREAYAAQDAVARADGWDDPALDDYNDYDAHKVR
jgi:hypothetical protein